MKNMPGEIELNLIEKKDLKQQLKDIKSEKDLYERLLHWIPEGILVADEKDADIAEQKVIEFANECRLTTDQIILGKIVAYLQAEKPDHYNALLDANIIK